MRVLAIGAHPDDVEILCGGTLAKCARRKDEIFVAIATNGEVGSATLTREEIAEVRQREARAACDVIGATLIWMGFPDEWLFSTPETRERFIDAIREAAPDVMFVHGETDYHPDHRAAGQIAIDARIPASVPLVATQMPPTDRIPHIFVMDNLAGSGGFIPEHFVDIGDVIETKKAMLRAHASQDEWLRHLHDLEGLEGLMLRQSRQRGFEANCDFAEAFREVKTYPRTGSYALLP